MSTLADYTWGYDFDEGGTAQRTKHLVHCDSRLGIGPRALCTGEYIEFDMGNPAHEYTPYAACQACLRKTEAA